MSSPSEHPGLRIWLSPMFWTERKIKNSRVPDAVFDVGPSGLAGWYSQMQQEYQAGFEEGMHAVAWLFICVAVSRIVVRIHIGFYPIEIAVNTVAVMLPLWFLWKALWHLGAASAYAKAWRELEDTGLQWRLENGAMFRLLFKRRDGSYKIDTTLRQQRVDIEIQAVRGNWPGLIQSAQSAGVALAVGVIVFFVALKALQFFPQTEAFSFDVAEAVALYYLMQRLPSPLAAMIISRQWKRDYDRGCQYIYGAKVLDPMQEGMTLETVKKSKAFGGSAFETPDDASRRLGGA